MTDYSGRQKLYKLRQEIAPLDEAAKAQAQARLDAIAKPLDGLGRLEQMLVQIAGIQGTADIRTSPRAVLVMCADNGVVREGVTQTSAEVTAAVAANIAAGRSTVNRMAEVADARVYAMDIGIRSDMDCEGLRNAKIRYGTADFAHEPAMTEQEALRAVQTGIDWVGECREQGFCLLGTGEMGIGNTTTATAVACALLGLSPEKMTGRGAGLDDDGLARKKAVIAGAIERYGLYRGDALTVLAAVGGLDIAGLAGIMIGGALYRIPIVLDGMITAAAALAADRLVPGVRRFLIPSHMSREPVMAETVKALELHPVLYADMALGEGTGAVTLFPMLDMALSVYRQNDSFDAMDIPPYRRYGGR